MTVSSKWYGLAIESAFKGLIDWEGGTIKCALTTSGYTPDQDADDFFDDVTNEMSAAGYTAGGTTLANCALTYTAGSNLLEFEADDAEWAGASIVDARYAVVYLDSGSDATSPLICYVDFGENRSASGGAFTIAWADGVVAKATVS